MNPSTFKGVLLCPPTYFTVKDVHNAFMHHGVPVNQKLACDQWQAVGRAFQQAGFRIESIPAEHELEDMVFAANQTFVGFHPKHGPFVVPSAMRFESRRREVPYYEHWFSERDYRVLELPLDGEFLEGGGDLLWSTDLSKVWAGFGFRSSPGGVELFQRAMTNWGIPVVPLDLVDPTFYHLDTCFAPLNAEAVMLYPGAFSAAAMDAIRKHSPRIHEVDYADAMQFVCNGVSANGCFLTGHCPPSLDRILRQENLQPVVVDTSEFEKSGGSVCCLKMFVV